jgi:hypothetical protein
VRSPRSEHKSRGGRPRTGADAAARLRVSRHTASILGAGQRLVPPGLPLGDWEAARGGRGGQEFLGTRKELVVELNGVGPLWGLIWGLCGVCVGSGGWDCSLKCRTKWIGSSLIGRNLIWGATNVAAMCH